MDSILLYYSFLNLIFLFNESVGSRETYSSPFACDIVLRVASSLVVEYSPAFLYFIHGLVCLFLFILIYFFSCVSGDHILVLF